MKEEKKSKDKLEMLLRGEKITTRVKTKRGSFVIALPLPRDLRGIEVNVARMLDGMPETSFSNEQVSSFRAYATLDVVVKDAPEWWINLDSAEDCPDDNLIIHLYRRYVQFYRKTQEAISQSGFNGTGGGSGLTAKDDPVDD